MIHLLIAISKHIADMNKLYRFELQFSFNRRFQLLGFLIAFILIAGLMSACSSGDLSRSQAQKMITESNDFKQPAIIELVQGNIPLNKGKGLVVAKSATELESEAIQSRISSHYASNPQMAVADYFGLIDARLKRTNDVPDPVTAATSNWYFNERYTITDKAKEIWEEAKLPVNETAVPVAFKEFIEVTGLTKQNENTVLADFSYKWSPNEVGKSLDSLTEEFRRLPEKVRQDLIAPGGLKNRNQTLSWEGNRDGKATFQKYDDGWRLISVNLF
jgi:hypothetical protein